MGTSPQPSTNATPTIVKLPKVGDTLSMAVMSCAPLKMGSYPEVEFVGLSGDGKFVAVRVPQKSADRQLQRCELDYAGCAGKLMTIGRSANPAAPAKPFWDVVLDGIADAGVMGAMPKATAPAQPSQPATPAAPNANVSHASPSVNGDDAKADRERRSTLYKRITQFVLSEIVPLYVEKKIPVTDLTCAAMAATLYIAETKNGH